MSEENIKNYNNKNKRKIYLPEVIGKGYKAFWGSKKPYKIVKGGRGSKKSTTIALQLIYEIMKEPRINALVIRKFYNTHRGSTYEQLRWAINRLGVSKYWRSTLNPLKLEYLGNKNSENNYENNYNNLENQKTTEKGLIFNEKQKIIKKLSFYTDNTKNKNKQKTSKKPPFLNNENNRKNETEEINKEKGGVIIFRGTDDPLSIASVTFASGYLCRIWFEEFYQIGNEDEFNKIDLSMRGKMPEGMYKQVIGSMNPWSNTTWIKARFFDEVEKYYNDIKIKYAKNKITEEEYHKLMEQGHPLIDTFTTNYMCNEFLDEQDIRKYEELKERYPRRYQIEGLGEWGISEGLVYENWEQCNMDEAFIHSLFSVKSDYNTPVYKELFGMDFGFTNDPTAVVRLVISVRDAVIYVVDELYMYGASNKEIYNALVAKGWDKKQIICDSAEPRTRQELKTLGVDRIKKVVKTKGEAGKFKVSAIQVLQDFKLKINPACTNFINEVSNYTWKQDAESGKWLNVPMDGYDHLMDAMLYACNKITKPNFSF